MSYLSPLLIYNVITFWGVVVGKTKSVHAFWENDVIYVLTFSFNACSTVGDIMTAQRTVTNRKYKAYMIRVPVDCLIFGQHLQQHEQAAEPQQQASCMQRTRQKRWKREGDNNNNFIITLQNFKQLLIQTLCVLWRSWENQASVQLSLSAVSLDKSKLVEKYPLKLAYVFTTLSMPNLVRPG